MILGEWSTYGVPGGKSSCGNTEWNIEVTLPVLVEMTMVASVSRPDITAREDARTVIGGGLEDEK